MAGLQDEIARLTAQVAALTTRVYQLEQKSAAARY
jgi:ubiquinone biosynthesis protein UbiJ